MKKFMVILLVLVVIGTCAFAEIDVDRYQELIDRISTEEVIGWDRTDVWITFNDSQNNRFHLYGDTVDPEVITWEWYVGEGDWDSEPSAVIELTEGWLCVYEDAVESIFENELS